MAVMVLSFMMTSKRISQRTTAADGMEAPQCNKASHNTSRTVIPRANYFTQPTPRSVSNDERGRGNAES